MNRPVWFRRRGLHWTPCAWQGCLLIAAYLLCLLLIVLRWAKTDPATVVLLAVPEVAVLIAIAAYTDDTHERS